MVIEPAVVHDLKTERPDVAPPLPTVLRLVPILFYTVTAGVAVLLAFFALQLRIADSNLAYWQEESNRTRAQLEETKEQRQTVEGSAKRAAEVLSWVEGSRPLQPLVVTIARSIGSASSIEELSLDRDAQSPAQIKMALKLNSDGTRQLNLTLERIAQLNYRTYSAQQQQGRGEMDYRATLLWQDPQRTTAPTEPATEPAP